MDRRDFLKTTGSLVSATALRGAEGETTPRTDTGAAAAATSPAGAGAATAATSPAGTGAAAAVTSPAGTGRWVLPLNRNWLYSRTRVDGAHGKAWSRGSGDVPS